MGPARRVVPRAHAPLLATLITLASLGTGCGSSAPVRTTPPPTRVASAGSWSTHENTDPARAEPPPAYRPAGTVETLLRDEERRWRGTPYRYGGSSRQGIDCSAFVQAVYRDAFGLDLPRSTTDQVTVGRPVSSDALQPGDLLFFRLPRSQHVGIYLGRGEFAHAATSQGVTTSDVRDPYWRSAYWTARRILTNGPQTPLTRPSSLHRTAADSRTGW